MALKTHVVLPGSKRGKDPAATPVGKVDPKEKIVVTIGLSGPPLPGPDEYVGQVLTSEELAKRFGAAQADADKVTKSLKKFGLKVEQVSLENRSMRVSGTAAAMEAAFKPGMAIMHSLRQGDYRGRQGAIMIPAELKGIVTGVFGLDQRRMARRSSDAAGSAGQAGALAPLTPMDLEQRYSFPPGDAAGQHIAIAEFGGGYFESDLKAYCNKFQRPTPNVQAIAVDAPAFTLQQILALPQARRRVELGDSVEVMMDVQVVAGLCPGASIAVYFSTFDQRGWIDLLNKVITAKPVALSISWGLPEDYSGWSANARAAINDRLNAARLLGITTCVSSGDDGSGDEMNDGHAHVDFPASSPYVLGVGGTMLRKAGGVKEVTWWESPGRRTPNGGGASGGGVSTVFPRPAWQSVRVTSLNSGSIDGRVVPDVAALAGEPMYDLVFVGHPQPNGGTSASAPLWAALIARINAKLPAAKQRRFLTPLLYQKSAGGQPVGKDSSHDVTSGNNASHPKPGKGYTARAGFDAVTGWGVPDGVKLLNSLTVI
ncbi:MAG TPA: S53 family peptidase [Candidatus Sulfotelmatobacter sp.]|nr:S53 family peptidase [Candidatus Sulfotelmatobacter sp.]